MSSAHTNERIDMTRLSAIPLSGRDQTWPNRIDSDEATDAVVLAFPRVEESQSALLASARDLIQTAWERTRSEAVARALVEADRLLEHLVVD